MGASVSWSCFAALLCLFCAGSEVRCDCTEERMQIEGGHYTLTKSLQTGSLLVYQCPRGAFPYPDLKRVCQANGVWTPRPKRFSPQKCKTVECPDPTVMENGSVSPPQERYYVGNETTYECYSGYTLKGSSSRTCLSNGKWSGSTPICSRDSGANCADPGIPAGATRAGSMFEIDDKVMYSCNGNLFLVGSSERVCLENGQWTGKEPACYYKYTYDTPLEVAEAFGSSIRDSLTILQSLNDTQEGRSIRISKNGTLNIYIAVDISESIEEKHFDKARKAVIALIKKIASFNVSPNYEIIFFSSEVYEVSNILDFFDGKANLDSVKKDLESFEIGDRNTGTDLNQVFRKFEENMAFIKRRVGDEGFKDHRHAIILFSDGAYNMGGSPGPTVARIKNMVYMNNNADKQDKSREEYLDIYVFAIGADIFDDDLQPLTVGLGGQHYFRMAALDKLQETFDQIIDESDVIGLCGLHKAIDDPFDKVRSRMKYPWLAFVINQGKSKKKCLGSLVTSKFILTAAHCFSFGDVPDEITVEIDDGQRSQVKKVKNFWLHPSYNVSAKVKEGVDEFYDYDIALVLLKEDIKISNVSRPICIPCTQATSDALQLVGETTCKKQEELLLKNHRERLSFLTRKEPLVAEKDVFAKLGDSRDICIQHALTAKGITTKDPKVAVTDNFLCTGGSDGGQHRDHIACTGDSGGAVFKNYEHRTIQIALVSWGTQELCTGGGLVESSDTSRDFHINLFRMVPFLRDVLGNENQDDYAPLTFLRN